MNSMTVEQKAALKFLKGAAVWVAILDRWVWAGDVRCSQDVALAVLKLKAMGGLPSGPVRKG